MIKKTVGKTDKTIRLILGLVLGVLAVFYTAGIFQILLGILALIMFVTAFTGFCPIYSLLGIRTNKSDNSDQIE